MSWACAVTFWHQQEEVVEQLVAKGFEYFFPRIKRTVRHRGKRVHRFDPLLFNYIPVLLSHPDAESDVRAMRGVMPGEAGMIGPVHADEIQRLKNCCTSDGVLIQPKAPRFKAGQAVRPKSNPDLIGEFEGERRGREVALFNILGGKRPIEFDEGDLVAV